MSALVMASLLYSPHLWQGSLRHELQRSVSRHVLSPPASYIGLAYQDGYIALRWINFESYGNLRKISSNFLSHSLECFIIPVLYCQFEQSNAIES
jgi:hypothetical protein